MRIVGLVCLCGFIVCLGLILLEIGWLIVRVVCGAGDRRICGLVVRLNNLRPAHEIGGDSLLCLIMENAIALFVGFCKHLFWIGN